MPFVVFMRFMFSFLIWSFPAFQPSRLQRPALMRGS